MKSVYVLDGITKLLAAGLLIVFLPGLEDHFLSPRWLVITAAVLLFLSAATEISYGVSKGAPTYLRHIVIVDAIIVGGVVVALFLAGMANPAGGFVGFGVIALGSLAIAVVFTTGANGPDFARDE